ncbi:MAG TPA: 4Fe-4S dicluster domain-containing protein [Desulfosporosinus sp.]|nr:4Fe-4S dicluster domain-containing protein [Desulfosporosinus sp.]
MKIIIDGQECVAEYGEFILQVAERNNIEIPTLCHEDALPGQACCRICIVEVLENKWSKIVTSCVYPITKEIEVITDSEKIKTMRRMIIMLLAARTPESDTIKKLVKEYDVSLISRFISEDKEKCILCNLCVSACEKVGTSAISTVSRGITKRVATPYDEASLSCIGCGACANVCPTGAIEVSEEDGLRVIWKKEFELIKCDRCGETYATREQLDYLDQRLDVKFKEYGVGYLCESCKRRHKVEHLERSNQYRLSV